MKKIFSCSISAILLSCVAFICEAQTTTNTPTGLSVPSAIFSTVGLPAAFYSGPGGTNVVNFTRTFVPQKPTTSETDPMFTLTPAISTNYSAATKTVYLNGWGQPIESILRGAPLVGGSSSVNDVITAADLRPSMTTNSFLPFSFSVSTTFQTTPFNEERTYYNSKFPSEGNMSYSQKVNSTVTAGSGSATTITPTSVQYSPGNSFVGNHRGVTTTTTIDDGSNDIEMYTAQYGNLVDMGLYPANKLSIKTVNGQHNESTVSFSDMDGKLVCKKVHAGTTGTSADWLITYYVYDDFGKLNYTLTPKQIAAGISTVSSTLSTLSFGYTYNIYGQPVSSFKPGKSGSDFVVYDGKQRAVLMQSPLLKSLGEYMFKIYDTRNRVVISGIFTDVNTPTAWQGWLTNPSSTTITSGTLLYYLVNGFTGTYPSSIPSCEIDNINYYDQYPSIVSGTFNSGFSSYYLSGVNMVTPQVYNVTQGMLTATQVRIKDPSITGNPFSTSQFFYDQKGNMIQVQTTNAWNTTTGILDITTMQYNFTGQNVLKVQKYNDVSPNPAMTVATQYNYDIYHNGRLTSVQQKVNGDVWRYIATYQYDDLGRKIQNSLGGGVEQQDLSYNIRGQLASINSDYTLGTLASNKTFGCILDYDYGFTQPRYDGDISGILWRGAGTAPPEQAYGYNYDADNRLLSANFRQNNGAGVWSNSTVDYTMSNATYDQDGNILSMNQMGTPVTGSPTQIDGLTYSYVTGTNQLQNVTDAISANYGLGDFIDGNVSATTGVNDYAYDADGNLIQDLNKQVTSTTYNELDKPSQTTFQNGSTIAYSYDAAGNLVKRVVTNAGSTPSTHTYRYWGPFVYMDNTLQYILHQEGRTRYLADSSIYKYDFFVKDHLGNVRSMVTSDATVLPGGISGISPTPIVYFAGHELTSAAAEDAIFTNIPNVRSAKPASSSPSDLKAAELNGIDSTKRIGTAILLHVMAYDKLDISSKSYWEGSLSGTTEGAGQMLGSIIGTLNQAQAATSFGEGSTNLLSSGLTPGSFAAYQDMVNATSNPHAPKAYINYLVFDETMKFLPEQSGAIQVSQINGSWQNMGTYVPITAQQSGYVAIYMSNADLMDVYMDMFTITVYQGRLLQEQIYYPFGLSVNEGEATGGDNIKNKFKFEGNEVYDDDELGLDLQNFNARQYDYQIGRFTGLDLKADQSGQEILSPYHFCANNPANMTDPMGMTGGWCFLENQGIDIEPDPDILRELGYNESEFNLPYIFTGFGGGGDGGGTGGDGNVFAQIMSDLFGSGQMPKSPDGQVADGSAIGNSDPSNFIIPGSQATDDNASTVTFTIPTYYGSFFSVDATATYPSTIPFTSDATLGDYYNSGIPVLSANISIGTAFTVLDVVDGAGEQAAQTLGYTATADALSVIGNGLAIGEAGYDIIKFSTSPVTTTSTINLIGGLGGIATGMQVGATYGAFWGAIVGAVVCGAIQSTGPGFQQVSDMCEYNNSEEYTNMMFQYNSVYNYGP